MLLSILVWILFKYVKYFIFGFLFDSQQKDTRETFGGQLQSSAFSVHDSSTLSVKQETVKPFIVPPDVALFNELNTAGSLFSIHSAPPVPHGDPINGDNEIRDIIASPVDGTGLLQQNHSTKSVFLELIGNKRCNDIEDDDNDNLLTVSSVTARPLIAKSHELRSNR